MHRIKLFLLTQLFLITIIGHYSINANVYMPKGVKKQRLIHKAARFCGEIIVDALMLNVNLFSIDSIKVITACTPFYLSARMVDEKIQPYFYDRENHKNIYQFSQHCHDVAHYGVGVPMFALPLLAFFGWNEDIKLTARLYTIGLPFVQSGKDIIKQLPFKSCLRPWNEHFSKEKRAPGGFPSGHLANVAYMTTLFGMRHGPGWGIPLGLFSAFVFADFVNCNRHYLSQLCAGAALGVIFALAADKVIQQKEEARIAFDCVPNQYGGATVKMGYRF